MLPLGFPSTLFNIIVSVRLCLGRHHCWAASPLGLGLSLYILYPIYYQYIIHYLHSTQCVHNHLPSLPNLPKCGLYYMGLAQNRWHTTPSVSLSFFMSSPSFLTRITELSSCAQDRVASHCMSVVAGFVV